MGKGAANIFIIEDDLLKEIDRIKNRQQYYAQNKISKTFFH